MSFRTTFEDGSEGFCQYGFRPLCNVSGSFAFELFLNEGSKRVYLKGISEGDFGSWCFQHGNTQEVIEVDDAWLTPLRRPVSLPVLIGEFILARHAEVRAM